MENGDRLINNQKLYDKQNRDKINTQTNEYFGKRRVLNNNYPLIRNIRSRIYQALKGNLKSSSTKNILGIDDKTYRKWLEYQMTP